MLCGFKHREKKYLKHLMYITEFCAEDESGNTQDWRDKPRDEPSAMPEPAPITMEQLMSRIRHHALTNRRRVIEFFQVCRCRPPPPALLSFFFWLEAIPFFRACWLVC